ncbi:MAG: F0F1 ATP synthase subunit B [Bacteroidales bacterium]|jgi:F-type H+-transporting ATPase subunit b|nr:F0F1 ATP synthase subunit B [Bacteroidales bacterium]
MIILANSLTTPAIGTVIWTTLIFSLFFFLLAKFAWKPILGFIKDREETIKNSLEAAETAREEMIKLQSDNEIIIRKAHEDSVSILKEAKEIKEKIIAEAKEKASIETQKNIEQARKQIQDEKTAAINDIKQQIAELSVTIAEKVLKKELSSKGEHNKMVDSLIEGIKLN